MRWWASDTPLGDIIDNLEKQDLSHEYRVFLQNIHLNGEPVRRGTHKTLDEAKRHMNTFAISITVAAPQIHTKRATSGLKLEF